MNARHPLLLGAAATLLAAAAPHQREGPRVRERLPGPLPAAVRIDAAAVRRRLPAALFGSNLQYTSFGDGVLDPATLALRPGLVAKARELALSTIRFPGGSHSDMYHWRDGVGPQADRRIGEGYFGSGPQSNEYGTDEHLALCAAVGAEATITLNFGTGTPQEAANWVEYLNGAVPAGGTEGWTVTSWDGGEKAPPGYFAWLRGRFGRPSPYGVRRFEVGNEVYNDWSARYDAAAYARRFLEYVAAVKAVDPTVKVAAVGYDRADRPWGDASEPWNRVVARIAGGVMDAIHVHTYFPLDDGHSLILTSPQPVGGAVDLPVTGTWDVRVQAVGKGGFGPYPPADGQVARLEIAVDGRTVGSFELTPQILATYSASRRLAAGRHTVSVSVPNAGFDPLTMTGRGVLLDSTFVLREMDSEVLLTLTDPSALHAATMAGPVQIGRELASIAEILRAETGRDDIEVWVTEANAWFGLYGVRPDVHDQLRAGVAAADLAMRAIDAGVAIFQQWSLVDDWHFGLIGDPVTLGERSGFHTFALLRRGLLPALLSAEVDAPTFDLVNTFGVVEPASGVPHLDVLATRDEESLAVVLANKHPHRTLRTDVTVAEWPVGRAEAETVMSAAPDTEDSNPDDSGYVFVPGKVGSAVRLDASLPLFHPTVGRIAPEAGTIELWLCPDWSGDDGEEHAVLSAGLLLHLFKTTSGHLAAVIVSEHLDATSVAATDVASWRAGDWHHVAITWKEHGTLELFVDGALAASSPLAARWTAVEHSYGLLLGTSSVVKGDGFEGAVDEVRVSIRPRDAAEVRASWQEGTAGRPLAVDPATTALFPFDGTIADDVRDERTHVVRRTLPHRTDGVVVDLPPTSLTLLSLRRAETSATGALQ